MEFFKSYNVNNDFTIDIRVMEWKQDYELICYVQSAFLSCNNASMATALVPPESTGSSPTITVAS